jgi:phenylalanyl-tRNA synthetase beta chain
LGRDIAPAEVRGILESLMFGVAVHGDGFLVTVPSWRATKDISLKDDLVEEIGRMVGYATITPEAPVVPTKPPLENRRLHFYRALRRACTAQGFDEVYNYSFLSEETVARFGLDPAAHLRVANPIASDQALMRLSLIPGIWKNIIENSKNFDEFRIFEIGFEIHKKEGALPDEVPHLVAAFHQRSKEAMPLYEVKRLAECLMPGCEVRPAQARAYEHPTRTAEVSWRGVKIGRLFEFHPNLVESRAVVLDIDLGVWEALPFEEKRYKSVRRFPESAFDLSFVAPRRALVGDLRNHIVSFAGPVLESISFLRVYEGAPLPEGSKSVSFRLVMAAHDRTLSSEEVTSVRDEIIQGMRKLGYDMRV